MSEEKKIKIHTQKSNFLDKKNARKFEFSYWESYLQINSVDFLPVQS